MHLLQCSIHSFDKLRKAWVQDAQLHCLFQWKFWWKWFRRQATCIEIRNISSHSKTFLCWKTKKH